MSVLLKVNDRLWVNPSSISMAESRIVRLDDDYRARIGMFIRVDGKDIEITESDWSVIEPLVTLPAPAAGSTPTPQSMTVINLVDADGKPLPRMNSALVGVAGQYERGSYDRAIAVACALAALGRWDGNSLIRVINASDIYNSLDQFVTIGDDPDYPWELVVRRADKPEKSVIAPAVDEIIAEEGHSAEMLEVMHQALEKNVSWVRVTEVEKDQFYSKTSRSHRNMWRLRTSDGRQVNMFDHADPLRDQKIMLLEAGYLDIFEAMDTAQVDRWDTHPIEIDVVTDGAFWKVVRVNARAADAVADEPVIIIEEIWNDAELVEWDDEGNIVHRISNEPLELTAEDFPNDPAFAQDSDAVQAEDE